jgi:hypothetical protein
MALTITRLTGEDVDGYTEVSIPNGAKCLYTPETSYITPIAAWHPSKGWIRTSTPPEGTEDYMKEWLQGNYNPSSLVDQSELEEMTIYLAENQDS